MPAAGFTLQDEATTFGVAFEGANERMETMELVFAGSEVDAHISGEQDDLGVDVSFRWVTGFPDMAAATAALAGATDLVAGDAAPMECLPTGAVLPQGVDDAVFDDGLAEQPFTLTGYTVELEEGGQQAARGLSRPVPRVSIFRNWRSSSVRTCGIPMRRRSGSTGSSGSGRRGR